MKYNVPVPASFSISPTSSPRLGLSFGQVDRRHGEERKEEDFARRRPGYHGVRVR